MLQRLIGTTRFLWLDRIIDKSKQLPHQGDFSIQGLKVAMHAYDPEVYHWVGKYIYPLCLANSVDTQLTYNINVFHSDKLVHAVLRSIGDSEVDTIPVFCGDGYLDRISISDDYTVDYDPFYGMVWVTERASHTITLVLSVKVRWPLLEVSALARDLITRFLADKGWLTFHAGAIHTENKNYIIIGDGGAGKTSFIVALLSAGAAYISNERVLVKVEDNRVHLLSFPMPIAVGLGTMMQYTELIEYIREPQYLEYPPRRMNAKRIHRHPENKWPELEDKPQFLPQDLSRQFFDIEGVAGGAIDGLIVPSFKKNRPARIERLNRKQVLNVLENNWIAYDDVYPPWMPLDFQQPSIDDANNTIEYLAELRGIRFRFSADKNRRNETGTFPKLLAEHFES